MRYTYIGGHGMHTTEKSPSFTEELAELTCKAKEQQDEQRAKAAAAKAEEQAALEASKRERAGRMVPQIVQEMLSAARVAAKAGFNKVTFHCSNSTEGHAMDASDHKDFFSYEKTGRGKYTDELHRLWLQSKNSHVDCSVEQSRETEWLMGVIVEALKQVPCNAGMSEGSIGDDHSGHSWCYVTIWW